MAVSQKYFQQHVKYKINVRLDDKKNTLTAFEEIIYTNNSPDTLSFLYFHLWPNGYKNLSTPMANQMQKSNNMQFYYSADTSRGYIDSLNFKINNEQVNWTYLKDTCDICKITLNKILLPGDSITISTPFFVKIPGDDFSRLGHYFQSYQITQWYPKPAVYDNNGWQYFSYLNQGEFYSEFGKFDVSITLPENYFVAATGVLQNSEELEKIKNNAEETSKILTFNKSENNFPESSKKYKTLRFIQDSIHDFAWFADKRFHILKGSIELPSSKRKVTTWIYFTNIEGNLWKNAIKYVNNGVFYYSKWVGEYPYSQCTAVESALGAGGGMEYPMITNIGWSGNAQSLENVIVHEVGHNWFYGILGFNERLHPWMDEGINSYYEERYTTEITNNIGYYSSFNNLLKLFGIKLSNPFDFNKIACDYIAHNGSDQALDLSSEDFITENYGIIAYSKGAIAMNYLKNYLGAINYDNCMHIFFNEWKFKHPYPIDLKNSFERCSEKKLSWFFDEILHNVKYSDYKLNNIKFNKKTNEYELVIKNKGNLNSPLNYSLQLAGKTTDSIWVDGFFGKKIFTINNKNFDKILIDPNNLMFEINRNNNQIKKTGIFRKIEPLNLSLLGIAENPTNTQFFYSPVIGWNYADGIMPGLFIYNPILPEKKFQYRLMPMYGINSKELTGIAYAEYNVYPYTKSFQKISLFANLQTFNSYTTKFYIWQKYDIGLKFLFNRTAIKPLQQIDAEIKTSKIISDYTKSDFWLLNTRITLNHSTKPFPYFCEFNSEFGPDYLKTWLEYKIQINYTNKNKGFSARIFAGTFIYNNNKYIHNNFNLSGTFGYNDYKFSEVFPDRLNSNINNIWGHQFVKNDGGFTVLNPINSRNWLTSANFKAAFPVPLPFSIYLNIATYYNAKSAFDGSIQFPYELGVELNIIKDIFAIYFPINMSTDIKQTNEMFTTTYFDKIRFILNFSKIVPFKYQNQLPLMF